ncbi:16564_t:CDS:2, partial [Racocetra persica]
DPSLANEVDSNSEQDQSFRLTSNSAIELYCNIVQSQKNYTISIPTFSLENTIQFQDFNDQNSSSGDKTNLQDSLSNDKSQETCLLLYVGFILFIWDNIEKFMELYVKYE